MGDLIRNGIIVQIYSWAAHIGNCQSFLKHPSCTLQYNY